MKDGGRKPRVSCFVGPHPSNRLKLDTTKNSHKAKSLIFDKVNEMKIEKLLSFGLISIFLCCFNSLTFAAAVYDDFNGSSIDESKWNIYDSAGLFSQTGGLLNGSTPPNGVLGSFIVLFWENPIIMKK